MSRDKFGITGILMILIAFVAHAFPRLGTEWVQGPLLCAGLIFAGLAAKGDW